MEEVLTRSDISEVLCRWRGGTMTAEQVLDWAGEKYQQIDVDVDDWEDGEENSVANEVLAALDMLDMNLMLPEDIPIYLRFLSTPIGRFADGYSEFRDALERIDYTARQKALSATPLYARFCRAAPLEETE